MVLRVDAPFETIGRRYVLSERLGSGGMGVVYSATDRLTGQQVALKRLTTPTESFQFASTLGDSIDLRLALAQEFRLLASLRHPNIISVLDYGFDAEHQPYFTMELLEDAQPLVEIGRDQPFETQIGLLVQVLQALAYLHRRGVVHRDLKPANVQAVNGQVKLLDFGLSIGDEPADFAGTTSGTIGYMAPEVLMGATVTTAADLYAVGVMAYELFTGQHPFDTSNPSVLIMDTLNTLPDTSALDVNNDLVMVVERLLAKDPSVRYRDAAEVIDILCAASGVSVSLETAAIRESFLQAAKLVSRESELASLLQVLTQAIEGQGSAHLIGGESGVGKSRLLDELRALALVRGALVLRGREVAQGGSLYQLWRDPLRWLSLVVELSDLEAGVLKPIISDIDALLGREVPDLPQLDDTLATQERLFAVVEELCRRAEQPAVLILEDLHWSDESLLLLSRLNSIVHELPLLVLGSYRDDERPDLPSNLPEMQVLKLSRLQEESIAQLSESMLGEVGRQPELVDLLNRETEGNVYFLVEVVRALAEASGDLEKIGAHTLPPQVFAGGIQRLVQHRLSRLPSDARPLLRLAATAGRYLDLIVLRAAYDGDLENWLITCSEYAILEVQDDQWRFVHDKLREGALSDLTSIQRTDLHRRLAEAIEVVYPNDPDKISALAYHWSLANNPDKEGYYTAKAGEQALQIGVYREAATLLTKALELSAQPTNGSAKREEALQRAHWERLLGNALIGMGDWAGSLEHMDRSLELLGRPKPKSNAKIVASLLWQVARQYWYRKRDGGKTYPAPERRAYLLELAQIYDGVARVYLTQNQSLPAFHAVMSSLNYLEAAGPSPQLARAYAATALAAAAVPLPAVAESYARRAKDLAHREGHLDPLAWVLTLVGVYYIGVARWDMAQDHLERALEIHEQLKNLLGWEDVKGALAHMAYLRGDFARSVEMFGEVYASANRTDNIQSQSRGLNGQALTALVRGQIEQAMTLLNLAVSINGEQPDRLENTRIRGLRAICHLLNGDETAALQDADNAFQLAAASQATVFPIMDALVGVAEVYLSLWEQSVGRSGVERAPLKKSAQKICKQFQKYAKSYALGAARNELYQGWYRWLSGKSDEAHAAWQKGLAAAQQYGMPYDEGLLHFQIGRHLDRSDSARQTHLNCAIDIFTQLGADYHLERAQAEIAR